MNLSVPLYSSYEVLKAKILQAIILDNVTLNAEQEAMQNDEPRHHDDYSDAGGSFEEEYEWSRDLDCGFCNILKNNLFLFFFNLLD